MERKGQRKRQAAVDPFDARPMLLADESEESSAAAIKLVFADLPFRLVPKETRGVALFTSRGTYRGLEGIERYIAEKTGAE